MHLDDLASYDYTLPPERIRKKPREPRDSARLFVYDTQTDTITADIFRNIAKYLPSHSLIVLNNTTVLPARLFLRKETGGKIEVLILANEIVDSSDIPFIVDRKTAVGEKLYFPNGDFLDIHSQNENIFRGVMKSNLSLPELLNRFGTTPIPHYLEGSESLDEAVLRKRYQTIFAKSGSSVAAPTASLHFTERVFKDLLKKGIKKTEITLNVGLGTFAPLSEENFITGKLHTEFVSVSNEAASAIKQAKAESRAVVAVGTTVTRTLEGIAKRGNEIAPYTGPLNTFLFPPHDFQVADILLTNFHLPKTSLLLLVDAFLENKGSRKRIMELYNAALQENFDFYSFGDAMLIL